jgi:hypothetical protein
VTRQINIKQQIMKTKSNFRKPVLFFTSFIIFSFCHVSSFSQGVGINAATPNTVLDVNGDFALRISSFTAGATNNNIVIGSSSFIRITGPGATFNINGIAGGVDGKMIILYNATSSDMYLNHQNTGSIAANRIICSDLANALVKRSGCAVLIYSSTDSRWIVVSTYKQ